MYGDRNELQDIRRIEQGVGQGFRFERGSMPSAEQIMGLAGTVAIEQIKGVSDEMIPFFKDSAKDLLAMESEVCKRSVVTSSNHSMRPIISIRIL